MEFALLGPLEARVDGALLPVRGTKRRALLALLLLNANRVVSRERLVDELWGESPPETAATMIQVYVSQLRKLLPEGTLLTQAPGYLLRVEPLANDLERFERLVEDARGSDPERAATLLREAVGLWRGPPLAEFGDVPFARAEGVRLAELRLAALEAAIDAELELGRQPALIGELEALIAEHPHRERLRAQLMLALYRSSRQADALAAYHAARSALAELGLEPSASLRELEKQILTQDRALDLRAGGLGGATVLPGPLVPKPRFPFVGRADELETLRAALERAEEGVGGVVLLGGEAGGGKTRLVRELAQDAAAQGSLVLYGTSDAVVRTPYQPLREWLAFALENYDQRELRALAGAGGELLGRLVPAFAPVAYGPIDGSSDPDEDRYVLQGAAADLLVRMSRCRPLLVIAEDIHWADAGTLQLVRVLARRAPASRMLLIATFRDRGEGSLPELDDTLTDLWRLDGVARLSLGRLDSDDVAAFIGSAENVEATESLVAAIGELTNGTPLLLCELWRDLLGSSGVRIADGVAALVRPLAEVRGPERVRDIVRQRFSRLADATVATLELAAVAGPRLELPLLAEAGELDRAGFVAAVEEAAGAGLIEELPDGRATWRFTHELVQRAIYDGISGVRRPDLHLRIGHALECTRSADLTPVLPELAHHFTVAAPLAGPEPGVDYNRRAAAAAVASIAYDEAIARFEAALELGIADLDVRRRVQFELSYLLRDTGRGEEASAALSSSIAEAYGSEQSGEALRLYVLRVGQLMGNPGEDPRQMIAVAENAVTTFTELNDPHALTGAWRMLALARRRQGRLAAALTVLERALPQAEAAGGSAQRRRLAGTLCYALCDGPTPVGIALDRCKALVRLSRGDRLNEALVNLSLSALLAMAGRADEARELVSASVLVFGEVARQSDVWVYRTLAAKVRELVGDVEAAVEEFVRVRDFFIAQRAFEPDARGMHAAAALAHLLCDEGRWEEADRYLDYGREVPFVDYFLHENVLRLSAHARVEAHRGNLDEAVSLGRRAVATAERSDFLNLRARTWLALAEVELARGGRLESVAARRAAEALYRAKGNEAALERMRIRQSVRV